MTASDIEAMNLLETVADLLGDTRPEMAALAQEMHMHLVSCSRAAFDVTAEIVERARVQCRAELAALKA